MHPDAQLKTALKNGFDPKLLYKEPLTTVKEPVCSILEKHSKVPVDKVVSHVNEVRDRAFAVFPYACIGQFSFVELSIADSPCYREMLERTKQGHKLLDLGCAFGQELRQLIYDGTPPTNLYGSDIQQDFLNLGYELFLDRAILPDSQLIAADVLDKQSALFERLAGELNIVYISLFLHVFDFEKQITVAQNVLDLLKAEPGSMIVCRVTACRDQGVLAATQERMPYYYHDLASWNRLWEEVQKQTGVKLSVESWEQPDELVKKHPLPGIYILGSSIRRL
ncbi:hypothetical protein PEBR_19813 [Penicillium brasilianum]|uniref:Meroterpenoid PM-122-9-5653 n=1 Tax=Penicillium brasilianum TaxID=104259 RepID=A0A1S9RNH8_PENBI|nr:meroterpenoid PM-122-9-5653 [Penicillium brasilianum]OOQ86840.1 hypothetical protein PEBR_19813 [Penicillium brasilianum]